MAFFPPGPVKSWQEVCSLIQEMVGFKIRGKWGLYGAKRRREERHTGWGTKGDSNDCRLFYGLAPLLSSSLVPLSLGQGGGQLNEEEDERRGSEILYSYILEGREGFFVLPEGIIDGNGGGEFVFFSLFIFPDGKQQLAAAGRFLTTG